MNRYESLFATSDVSVSRFDHPPHEVHEDPDEEVSQRWAVAFVWEGSFRISHGRRSYALRPGSVLLSRPGQVSRCAHDECCPRDVCVSVGFAPAAVAPFESAWHTAGWQARVVATPHLAYVDRRLARAARAQDPFELERWALGTLDALQADGRAGGRGRYAADPHDVDAVVAACEAIEADPGARRSIAERARAVGRSSTQLTHAFRRYLGESPHQVVIRWRLARAAELRSEGWNVSESCFRAGFENLSHFSRSFQRAFGVRASAWPALALAERRRKVQDLLRQRS